MAIKRSKSGTSKAEKQPESDAGFSGEIQERLVLNLEDEYTTAKRNMSDTFSEADEYYDMIHCVREDLQFDDEPNIYLPEYLSRLLAEQGNFCAQYFGSRDYVDIYQESDDPKDVAEAKASKDLLNTILNMPENHYFHKLQRLKMAVTPKGYGIVKGGYKQVIEKKFKGYDEKEQYTTNDDGDLLADDGELLYDTSWQVPGKETLREPIYEDVVVEDRPTFDVYPNKDVFFSPEYTYSLQDKKYVIFHSEKTLADMEADKEQMGYFNLNILKERYEKYSNQHASNDDKENPKFTVSPTFQLKERWGELPFMVKRDEETDEIIDYKPGIDDEGEVKEGAEILEGIETGASFGQGEDTINHLIRYQLSPHSKRPLVRFLCYVDEEKDSGFGDGEGAVELQQAANDNFNLGLYRTMLATKPFFIGKKYRGLPSKVRVFSEEVLEVEARDDIEELEISDDINGSIAQDQRLQNAMDRLTAYSSTTLGDQPDRRETATASSIVDQRASIRQGLKNLNMEFIGFTEFYNMLLTLCNDFMLPETLEKLIGEKAYAYNPEREDRFKPVTQAIETEYSKNTKGQMWQNVLQVVGGLQNPKTPQVVNYIIGQMLELIGGDFKVFKKYMFEEDPQAIMQWNMIMGMGQSGGVPPPAPQEQPMQNQMGMQQGAPEQQARTAMGQ